LHKLTFYEIFKNLIHVKFSNVYFQPTPTIKTIKNDLIFHVISKYDKIHHCYLSKGVTIESYFLTFDLNLTQVLVYRMIIDPQLSLVINEYGL
jgi:hypothetical protein